MFYGLSLRIVHQAALPSIYVRYRKAATTQTELFADCTHYRLEIGYS